MALKENILLTVGGVDVVNYNATANFTTDALKLDDFRGWTLSAWFPILNGANPRPILTIEVSNSPDVNSFVTYNNISRIMLPEFFEDSLFKPNYIRFVYTANGVGAGSTITFNFNLDKL